MILLLSCRAPQGARGLKLLFLLSLSLSLLSRPARGAWVEIAVLLLTAHVSLVAPRKGRVG